MNVLKLEQLKAEIKKLHETVSVLKELFPVKEKGFTLDGRLVGDIGEVIAEEHFQIKLHEKVKAYYDAVTTYEPELNVQIKATFKDQLTYTHNPDYFIGIKLHKNGDYDIVYNGPGKYIHEAFQHRKGIGKQLLSFPVTKLQELNDKINDHERILEKPGMNKIK
jgi:hypothetical protein